MKIVSFHGYSGPSTYRLAALPFLRYGKIKISVYRGSRMRILGLEYRWVDYWKMLNYYDGSPRYKRLNRYLLIN